MTELSEKYQKERAAAAKARAFVDGLGESVGKSERARVEEEAFNDIREGRDGYKRHGKREEKRDEKRDEKPKPAP